MMRSRSLLPILLLLLFFACLRPNQVPHVDYGRGSGHVAPDTVYTYRIVIEDRDGDSVQCEVDWGDGSAPDSGDWDQSPAEYLFSHAWDELGRYEVFVTCRDNRGAEAKPFLFTWVSCESLAPPSEPVVDSSWGDELGFVGLRYRFWARATDVNRDRVRIQFRWGDGTESEWSRWARSGDAVSLSHSWLAPGRFPVDVRAEDKDGMVSAWTRAGMMAMLTAPAKRWERSLDEPDRLVPVYAGDRLVVVDRGEVLRLNPQNGNLGGVYLGPGDVRFVTGSAAAGVFLRDESAAWGFTAGGQSWQTEVPGDALGLVLAPALLAVADRDGCRLLRVTDGRQQAAIAVTDLNLAEPVMAGDGLLYCAGDSLRAFRTDGTLSGAWPAPSLLPDQFVAGPRGFVGSPLCSGCEVVVFGFDTTGVRWQRTIGDGPVAGSPFAPIVGPNRRVYATTRDSVFAFNPDGTVRWTWAPDAGERLTTATPCLGARGHLMLGVAAAEQGALVALDSTGRESWRVSLETRAPVGIVLAPDSVVYGIGMDDPAAFAVYVSEPPAPDPCWPMYRHDAGLSGRVWGP